MLPAANLRPAGHAQPVESRFLAQGILKYAILDQEASNKFQSWGADEFYDYEA